VTQGFDEFEPRHFTEPPMPVQITCWLKSRNTDKKIQVEPTMFEPRLGGSSDSASKPFKELTARLTTVA